MVVGIHNTFPDKPDRISDAYRKILDYNRIEYIDLNVHEEGFWERLQDINCFIYRMAHTDYHYQLARTILPIIEKQYEIPCFPNESTRWHYDDKIRQYYLLKSRSYPVVKSYIFWDKKRALKWIEKTKFPKVFKLKSGSGSLQVKMVKSKKKAARIAKKMFNIGAKTNGIALKHLVKTFNYDFRKIFRFVAAPIYHKVKRPIYKKMYNKQHNYAYFQDYLPNDYDTRVQITGGRAFAFVRYNRPNDFRASGSNNWSIAHDKIDMRMVEIAFRISREMGFQSMAYDFIYDEKKNPVIVEISYCFGDYPEFSNGYWTENFEWVEGHFLPQYFELVDLLGMPELKMPKNLVASSTYAKVKLSENS